MIYIFLGPPASGKGTQAKMLAQALNIPYVSIGEAFRRLSATNPEVKALIDKGDLVPFPVYADLMQQLSTEYPDTCILDGAMRSTQQVNLLIALWPPDKCRIIQLELADETIYERTGIRIEGDGSRREDDRSTQVVHNRIQLYRSTLPEVIERIHYYHIPIITIDGSPDPQSVHETVISKIKDHAYTT